MSEPLVIIGNGMAAAKLAEELSRVALGRYAIAVIGEEPRLAYNRVLLSSVLAGEVASSDIELKPANWWRDHGVTLRYGCKATAVDLARRSVLLENEVDLSFPSSYLQRARFRCVFPYLAPSWRASIRFATALTSTRWTTRPRRRTQTSCGRRRGFARARSGLRSRKSGR